MVVIIYYLDVGEAVQMIGVKVPAYIFMGDSVQLSCDYDMQTDKLYSVTWYKDNEEFYRFVPSLKHPKHSYKMDGITVDVSIYLFIYISRVLSVYFTISVTKNVEIYMCTSRSHHYSIKHQG